VGKYGSGAATPNSGFSMVVETGGKITVADAQNITSPSKATGTWRLTGNLFEATYTYGAGGSTFTFQANWSNDGKMTIGTYGTGASATGTGTWFMDRKNQDQIRNNIPPCVFVCRFFVLYPYLCTLFRNYD
jgi:hypothetical protein